MNKTGFLSIFGKAIFGTLPKNGEKSKFEEKKIYKPGEALDIYIAGGRVPTKAVYADINRMRFKKTGTADVCILNLGGRCWAYKDVSTREMLECSTVPVSFIACAYNYFTEIQQMKIDRLLKRVELQHEKSNDVTCVTIKNNGKRSGVFCKKFEKRS